MEELLAFGAILVTLSVLLLCIVLIGVRLQLHSIKKWAMEMQAEMGRYRAELKAQGRPT